RHGLVDDSRAGLSLPETPSRPGVTFKRERTTRNGRNAGRNVHPLIWLTLCRRPRIRLLGDAGRLQRTSDQSLFAVTTLRNLFFPSDHQLAEKSESYNLS